MQNWHHVFTVWQLRLWTTSCLFSLSWMSLFCQGCISEHTHCTKTSCLSKAELCFAEGYSKLYTFIQCYFKSSLITFTEGLQIPSHSVCVYLYYYYWCTLRLKLFNRKKYHICWVCSDFSHPLEIRDSLLSWPPLKRGRLPSEYK